MGSGWRRGLRVGRRLDGRSPCAGGNVRFSGRERGKKKKQKSEVGPVGEAEGSCHVLKRTSDPDAGKRRRGSRRRMRRRSWRRRVREGRRRSASALLQGLKVT